MNLLHLYALDGATHQSMWRSIDTTKECLKEMAYIDLRFKER